MVTAAGGRSGCNMPGRSDRPEQLRCLTAGMEFAVTFGLLLGGGLLLDRRLSTSPAFTLAGAAVGFFAALYRLVRQVRRLGGPDDGREGDGGER